MQCVVECVHKLVDFFMAVGKGKWVDAGCCYDELVRIELQATIVKRDIRLHLPNSLLTPIARTDLLDLLSKQGEIVKIAKKSAELIFLREMTFPESLSDSMLNFVKAASVSVDKAMQIIDELDELIETAFSNREIDKIRELITSLDLFEQEIGRLQCDIFTQLNRSEPVIEPVDVIFLYRATELVGNLAEQAHKVGNQMQVIIAR